MKKCICFLRVSSQRQDLTPQREAVLAAAQKEYKLSEIVVVEGKESAIKLKEEERQTLNEMKSIVEQNPTIESIYFFAVDRLARRVSIVMSIKEWADEKKINLVFLNPYPFSTWFKSTDGIWKKNDISDIYLMFLGFGAKMEMQIKAERFAAAKAINKQQNKPNGRMIFGYMKDENKNVIINPKEAYIVRWIFDKYLTDNISTIGIYNEGIELGYWDNVRDFTTKSNHIRGILINYCYAGRPNKADLVYPAIVDEETVDAAIAKLKQNKIRPKSESKNLYYSKGLIYDEDSNYMMMANLAHCKYNIKQNIENRYGISMNVADYLIWRTAFAVKWNLMTVFDRSQPAQINEQITDIESKINVLKRIIEKEINPKFEKAYNAYINGKGRITETMYNQTIDELDKQQKEIQKKIQSYERRILELTNIKIDYERNERKDINLQTLIDIKDDKQRIDIIKECITKMTVKREDKNKFIIRVHHKLPDSPSQFIYIRQTKGSKVYWAPLTKKDLSKINIIEGVLDETLFDITDEIEKRFVRTDK